MTTGCLHVVMHQERPKEVGVSNRSMVCLYTNKELLELLIYTFNSAKDFKRKLRKRSGLRYNLKKSLMRLLV